MSALAKNFWGRIVATSRLWRNPYEDYGKLAQILLDYTLLFLGRSNQFRYTAIVTAGIIFYFVQRSHKKNEAKKELRVKEKHEIIKEALARATSNI